MYTIYSKESCSYCDRAKELLTQKGLSYNEKILDVGQTKLEPSNYYSVAELQSKVPGARTVPQIFEGDILIGGFDALKQKLVG